MVFDKLFPRGSKKRQKYIAKIRATIKRIEMNSKKFEKKSQVFRLQAKRALKAGNRELARNKLVRWKAHRNRLEKYQNFAARLERQMDAINEAEMIKDFGSSMSTSAQVLDKVASEISPEKAMEISETSEEAIAKIEEAGDLLAGDLEEDFELDIEDELTKLETEMLLEDAGEIPTAPITEAGVGDLDGELDEDASEKKRLQKELEKLKKELG
ncbi:MAG: Snf7 family protein [Promethearchaeota archaeon]